jgi:hypothetical protein
MKQRNGLVAFCDQIVSSLRVKLSCAGNVILTFMGAVLEFKTSTRGLHRELHGELKCLANRGVFSTV